MIFSKIIEYSQVFIEKGIKHAESPDSQAQIMTESKSVYDCLIHRSKQNQLN
jgi:hypothetical protein